MGKKYFAIKLTKLRKNLGMTQEELGNKIGVSASTIGMYEQSRREPDSNKLNKICKALNVSTDYLIGNSKSVSGDKDVLTVLSEFTNELSLYDDLMLDGKIISDKDKQKIIDSIKIAARLAIESK